jgi:hypothetical protein
MAALSSLPAAFFAIPSLTCLELVFDEHRSSQKKKSEPFRSATSVKIVAPSAEPVFEIPAAFSR